MTHDDRIRSPWRTAATALVPFACAAAIFSTPTPARAVEITGVQAASFDLPHVYAIFRDPVTDAILPLGTEGAYVPAYLDTGASGILISQQHGAALGLVPEEHDGQTVEFYDIGVAGAELFHVSQQLVMQVGAFTDQADPSQESHFDIDVGTIRMQMRLQDPDTGLGPEAINVFGMPLMMDRVMVYDATPIETGESLYTSAWIYEQGTPFNPLTQSTDPGIPETSHQIRLSYGDFAPYTLTLPEGAPMPTLAHNPFIGPSPTGEGGADQPPPVTATRTVNGLTQSFDGSWLLDTGATISLMAEFRANDMGVYYRYDEFGDRLPILVDENDVPLAEQFSTLVGGVGSGAIEISGFYLDSLTLPTTDPDDPIVFNRAPVFVLDIVVEDEFGDTITLDGVFGANYYTASFGLSFEDPDGVYPTPFNWFVFDEAAGILGLDVRYDLIPEPGGVTLALLGAAVLLRRRRGRTGRV